MVIEMCTDERLVPKRDLHLCESSTTVQLLISFGQYDWSLLFSFCS